MIPLDVDSGAGSRQVDLLSYLDAAREERAHEEEYAWIKGLRAQRVDGVPFRARFTLRGDSLWWFAELYLHKEQAILNLFRALAAFEALAERERPLAVRCAGGPYAGAIARAAEARRIQYAGPSWPSSGAHATARLNARAMALSAGSQLSRFRSRALPREAGDARVAAFVHRAFWRMKGRDGSAESYIGPVLRALEVKVGAARVRYVGVGPRTNFRARRWWDPMVGAAGSPPAEMVPIERYAPASRLHDSRRIYRERHAIRRSLWASEDLRAHSIIKGCDCWPLVRQQLAGIALLQFPWSARAMDEAAAALDAIAPSVAVTYAEAGGWGRAIALECRRRGIPMAGLQHGFIYRHWLNYRHERDEMAPDPAHAEDRGFPRPAATLVFDDHAARHLVEAGRFPPETIEVTGSPRLDELIAATRTIAPEAVEGVRREAGAVGGASLILFAAKEREARRFLPALVAAIDGMDAVQLVIKPHPAETPAVYDEAIAGARHVRVVDAATPLPPLLAAARAIVTVNSTVAVDGLALGIPALVIGLPNNLSPFVDDGLMLGAGSAGEIRLALAKLLYDQEFRGRLARAAEGQSASRSADAILALAGD